MRLWLHYDETKTNEEVAADEDNLDSVNPIENRP